MTVCVNNSFLSALGAVQDEWKEHSFSDVLYVTVARIICMDEDKEEGRRTDNSSGSRRELLDGGLGEENWYLGWGLQAARSGTTLFGLHT
jgi:hypothetical protein